MKEKTKWILWGIILLGVICLRLSFPAIPIKINKGPFKVDTIIGGPINIFGFRHELDFKKGLDIQGGIHVVLRADMSGVDKAKREQALRSAKEVVSRRVDLFGVTEPTIQTSRSGGEWRIVTELPGVTDTDQALELIGETAQLDFRRPVYSQTPEQDEATAAANNQQITGFEKTELTGEHLSEAEVTFDPQTGQPNVSIVFDNEGTKMFATLTEELVNKPLAIFLDGQPISVPRVQEKIADGRAVISGDFDIEQARSLAIQLNAGALPVPLEIVEQRHIEATLGRASVQKTIVAGGLGLVMVALFMILYYGKLGLLANLALLEYGLITAALYKLIPVTLTMAGLTGFILSIGMAVDSNILIFERIREELRKGTPRNKAMERGFVKALDAIKDANICTLIICFLLFNPFGWSFLNTSGMVRGFALTLALGVLVSLFTGVVVTRTLVRAFFL